ncbi:MAG: hypothetical protein ABIE25_05630 [Thermoplasmatota archaeon]
MKLPRVTVMSILVGVMTVTTLLVGAGIREVSAASRIVFQEDFEGSFPGSWSTGDADPASGLDYWGTTNYRAHQGSLSAWCAQIGTYSGNGQPNSANHYYDQDMHAYMITYVGDLSHYDSVSISFYYWAVTGSFSLADYLSFFTSPDGGTYTERWSQPDVSSGGWQAVTLSLPLDTKYIYFRFISDPTVGWGPYEGAYVDDIVITASDSQAPISSVGSLTSYQTTSSFSVPYTASDSGGSGLAYVELYYRFGASGAFTLFTTTANPSGHWAASPIYFDSSVIAGDGIYQFYSRAIDTFGNYEGAPSIPDASTTVDTAAPSTAQGLVGTLGSDGWYRSSVSISLVSSDITSGIASTLYQLDTGGWQTYSSSFSLSSEGTHVLDFYSMDNAGNSEMEKSVSIKIDTVAPATTSSLVGSEGANGWYIGNSVTVNLTSADSSSGISSTQYRVDNGNWQLYSTQFTITKQGTTTIDYYTSDVAGNVETQRSVSFNLDSVSPSLTIISPSNASFVAGTVDMTWLCSDSNSIAKREVKVDASDWQSTNVNAFSTHVADGTHTFQVRVTDLAGNVALAETTVVSDTVVPQVAISGPQMNDKINKNDVVVSWSGSDELSGIDHYEVQITGGQWVNVGNATSYQFTNLDDVWYSVTVKAVDKSGNTATSTVGFGIYTSIWSTNGPYQGIPLFALIGAIVAIIAVSLFLWYRKRKPSPQGSVSKEPPKTE